MKKKNLAVFFLAIAILLLLVIEVSLRLTKQHVYYASLTQSHPYYNHTLIPNLKGKCVTGLKGDRYVWYCQYNSFGLCQPEEVIIPKPNGTYRILIIGDSFVMGLKRPATIPDAIGRILGNMSTESGERIEVVNCGQDSYSPLLHLARLKHQYIKFEPNAIILMPDLTDVFDDNFRYKNLAKEDVNGNLIGVSASQNLIEFEKLHARAGFYSTNSYLVRAFIKKVLIKVLTVRGGKYNRTLHQDIFSHAEEEIGKISNESRNQVRYTVDNIKKIITFARQKRDLYLSGYLSAPAADHTKKRHI